MSNHKISRALLVATSAFVSAPMNITAAEIGGRLGKRVMPSSKVVNDSKIDPRIGKRRMKPKKGIDTKSKTTQQLKNK